MSGVSSISVSLDFILSSPGAKESPFICKVRSTGEYFFPYNLHFVNRTILRSLSGLADSSSIRIYNFDEVLVESNPMYRNSFKGMCWRDRELLKLSKHLKEYDVMYMAVEIISISIYNKTHASVQYLEVSTGNEYVLTVERKSLLNRGGYICFGTVREYREGSLGKLFSKFNYLETGYSFNMCDAIIFYLKSLCDDIARRLSLLPVVAVS